MSVAMLERLTIDMPSETVYDISSLGEGIVLRNRRTVEFTPEYAANFLEQYAEFWVNDEKVDRKLSEPHVIHLAREMLAGNFRWEQVNLVVAELEGRAYRLNGQHTAWGRLYADEQGYAKDSRCPVQLLRYDVPSIQDARRLYASLDRGRPRGTATVVNSHLLGSEEFPGYKAQHLKLLAEGIGVWLWERATQKKLHQGGDDQAYLLLKDHHKVALTVGTIIKESKAAEFKHMKRAPVIGAMFETCNKAPAIAREFWLSVRDGIGLGDKEDPRWVLREYLKSTSLSKSTLTNGDYKIVSQEEQYRACIHAWNIYRANRRIKHIRVALGEDRPVAR